MPHLDASFPQVDAAFVRWERLRRRLYRREQDWAVAVTAPGDRQRLAHLKQDIAQLKHAADQAFGHAMAVVEAAGRPSATAAQR